MSCARITVTLPYRSAKTSIQRGITHCPALLRPRFSACTPLASAVPLSSTPLINGDNSPLKNTHQHVEERSSKRREYLLEETARKLQRNDTESVEKLKLIDNIQRLGIGYYFEDAIDAVLRSPFSAEEEEDLFTAALRFRLLRHNGIQVTPEIFLKFKDERGEFDESDTLGLLSLYEASNLGVTGEEILEEAMEFAEPRLRRSLSELAAPLRSEVAQALDVPRHLRMARLEARRFIEQYGKQSDHDGDLLELAILDYNQVQAQHQSELTEITRWWKQLGLVEKLGFGRDRALECFMWTMGILPHPKYSSSRIESAKAAALLYVIDDIFDTYGKMDELILFTDAIRRWDLEAMEGLPEYMKICYMALYNTTNEICYRVLKDTGRIALPYLKSVWIETIEAYMVEVKWFSGGSAPKLEEYIENGASTVGAYMVLVHLFFLIGEGLTHQNVLFFKQKPYHKPFSAAGRIFRLWDDLGTSQEEEERGDMASSIRLFMKEYKLSTVEEARSCVLEEISRLWKDLNEGLISIKDALPLTIVKVALNIARTSQVVYKHEQHTYMLSVDNYVEALFFTPLLSS
uniref:R-linalool synthase, chloroplastic n=1 Tax=Ocimum basilicum TaxID=39350 RepID=LLOS_OCIBA|nr:RecName: Full=R-linalool synthase, chloroplastic; Flags: Precursor [Ocimum basilicum]AAV63789.1 R-linalool synthase [Ocimum basilicum]